MNLRYHDTVKLATTSVDGYGDRAVTWLTEVPALFIKRAGVTLGDNTEGETSDAAVYLLHTDPNILALKDELEGMYIIVEPFSESNWYEISTAHIAERKLLNNAIDNIYCHLDKVAGMPTVGLGPVPTLGGSWYGYNSS